MGNPKRNVEKNRDVVTFLSQSYGYEWGTDTSHFCKFISSVFSILSYYVSYPVGIV